ncbi:MAG: response regulator [Deltaproteobacteria bacterium]|nr:response regulator [Deltaproteobacteria bacterium]
MGNAQHSIVCVDDEQNILQALKRLLRKEPYRVFTASSGPEALKILEENEVQVIITDQRMPEMSGTELLAEVRKKYPDTIRIVLSGYTEVDTITESINKGHVYKFFLKPWDDPSLKLEIRQALEQYDLIQANRSLNEKVLEQNEALKKMNEDLEDLVQERTKELQIQNHVLELSRAMLEDMPVPIIGISADGMIVVTNLKAQSIAPNGQPIALGREMAEYFSEGLQQCVARVLETGNAEAVDESFAEGRTHRVVATPLSGRFRGRGVVLTVTDGMGHENNMKDAGGMP